MCLVLMFFIFEKKVETLFIFLGNSKKEDLAVLFDQKINNTRFIILVFVFHIEILLIINLIFILPNAL